MEKAAEARRKDLVELGMRLKEKLKEDSVGNGQRKAIEDILKRIKGGDNFICAEEDCDKLIPIGRIEFAVPDAKLCCPCQKRKDKKSKEPRSKEVLSPNVLVITSDHK